MKIRRILAFIIDFTIVGIISMLAINVLNSATDKKYDQEIVNLHEKVVKMPIKDAVKYLDKNTTDLNYKYRYTILKRYSIEQVFQLLWFIVLAYFTSFQTLGKYLLKIRIFYEKPSLWRHALREFLQLCIPCILIVISLAVSWTSENVYNLIAMNLQTIIGLWLIVNALYMIFSKENLTLVDRIVGSKIIEMEKK